jgi:hypothetical protein
LWCGWKAFVHSHLCTCPWLQPNQTPLRDSYFLEKLVGLGANDGVPINSIVQHLFLVMGVWPLIYNALLIPSAKSGNNVPAWPFIVASYGVGGPSKSEMCG